MESITREEINRRLEILRASASDGESYKKSKDRPSSAMCYMVLMNDGVENVRCDVCDKVFRVQKTDLNELEYTTDMLRQAGLVAK